MNGRGDKNLTLGRQGEELAAEHLRKLRYRILERNYRCHCGEVDIVARQGTTVVFVEVKTRSSQNFGHPASSVTPFKQRQISRAAQTWLAANRKADTAARFDVVAITMGEGEVPRIEHIVNAFDLPS